ncbi:MAG TPA: PAS domain S-box protein, partial [Pyrinomonadaceae bacterium]|nr:PAS domain S-box protein [Pyrinomonadaceae bacterium]
MDKRSATDSERFAKATLDALSEHIAVLDAEGAIVFVNRAWREFAAANSSHPEGLTEGANYFDVCLRATGEDDDARGFAEGLRSVISGHVDIFSLEYPCHAPNQQRWYLACVTRFELEGEVCAVVSHANVSGRKLAEEGLRFRSNLLDTVEQAVMATDVGGTIIYWNRFAEKLYGWPAAEITGRNIIEVASSQAARERASEVLSGLSAGQGWSGEFTVRRRDGTTFPAFITDTPIYDDKGSLVGIVGVSIDITERKLAEEELRRKEDRFRVLFELGPVAVFACDSFGVIQDYNRRAAELWGREPKRGDINERFCGSFKLYHPDGRPLPHAQSPIVEVLRTGIKVQGVEVFIERPCGSKIPVIVNFSSLKNEQGEVVGAITSFLDISERKKAEEALRESEEQLRAIFEASRDGILVEDGETILFANSAYAHMLGYDDPYELGGRHVYSVVAPEDAGRMLDYGLRRLAGDSPPAVYEFKGMRKDGSLIDLEASVSTHAVAGKTYITTAVRDISERKRAEEALRQAYDELERRVEERTAEIAGANEMLKTEMAERLRAEQARQELLRRLVLAQEDERRRISRELHDQMGQQLTAIMMGLKALDAASYGRQSIIANLQQLQELTNQLAREVHSLAWGLRPPALDDLGLHTALYNYVEEWAKQSQVLVDFHSSGFENGRLPLAYETTIYRIAQEALTNVVKHSDANQVSFIVEWRDDQ